MWHVEAELQALEALTAADVVTFLREEVSAALHLEALLHGNIAAAEAGAMCSAVLQVLGKGAFGGGEEGGGDEGVRFGIRC